MWHEVKDLEPPRALADLGGVALGPYKVRLSGVTSRGYFEQFNFVLELGDRKGRRAEPPLFSGLYSDGRPASGITGWIDGVFCSPVYLSDGTLVDLVKGGLTKPFFARLGELIPPNGRLMVAYEAFHLESPLLDETSEALNRKIPPLATPIGELLFYADCWLNIRDWYIPEGGREGHRKLQGNKALDDDHRQRRAEEAVEQLRAFLRQANSTDDALAQAAYERSSMMMATLLKYTSNQFRERVEVGGPV